MAEYGYCPSEDEMAEELELLSPEERLVLQTLDDPRCKACGFPLHSHLQYSQICPVLVRGMLHQFRKAESDGTR